MDATWIPLQPKNTQANTPPLLVKSVFTRSSYSIYLTDLSRIWHEDLDRRQVIRRALNENTSIDPSEDANQLWILLEKIQSAVRGVEGTACFLEGRQSHGKGLLLRVTAPLPPPLGALQWPIHLALCSQDTLRQELVLPLFGLIYHQKQRSEDLLARLGEKDHVISKLMDKLEASGMDISSVFPSAAAIKASRKLSQREQAATQVKGLAKFDSQHWQLNSNPQSIDKSAVLDMMHDDLLQRDFSRLNPSIGEMFLSEWWSNLKPTHEDLTTSQASREAQFATKRDEQSHRVHGDEVEDNGFQKQSTPPGLKKRHANEYLGFSRAKGPNTHEEADNKDDTTDDDDLDTRSLPDRRKGTVDLAKRSPPSVAPRPDSRPPETKDDLKKPWTIGGSKFKALPQKDQRNAQPLVADPFETEDHSTTDGDDEHASVPVATPPPIITDDKGSPRKTKLGHIGGQKKIAGVGSRVAPSTASASVDVAHDRRDGLSAPARGTARSKSPQLPSSPMSTNIGDATEQTRPPSTSEASDKPPESSQEMADRKRAELKRQLEAKAAAPGKKKRRF